MIDVYNDSALSGEEIAPLATAIFTYQPIVTVIRFWSEENAPATLYFYVENANGLWVEGRIDEVMLSSYEIRPHVWADQFGRRILHLMLYINRN